MSYSKNFFCSTLKAKAGINSKPDGKGAFDSSGFRKTGENNVMYISSS